MSQEPTTIPKNPALKPAEDYYRLRREGIGFIEQMGNRLWTDYNTHDPGITILEALCYAITDLSHRTDWEIKDILSLATPSPHKNQPFPNQAFFTAGEILTVNPSTPDDFRRLLIDLDGVRNAWVFCKECACDFYYYAWCEKDQLVLSYQRPKNAEMRKLKNAEMRKPENAEVFKKVEPRGLYEVLLELETDPELGDLNDRKIVQTFATTIAASLHTYTLELRFPAWDLTDQKAYDDFTSSSGTPDKIELKKFSRSKIDNNPIDDDELRQHWRDVFYLTFSFPIGGETIEIHNAALRIFGDFETKNNSSVNKLQQKLTEKTATGFIQSYRRKLQKTAAQVKDAKSTLNSHRNLDEDYCRIKVVAVEDVAVCADVEVAPDADIERVQAQIWFEIEQYFNPPVSFYTLQEMMKANVPVEEIFNGPKLSSGFIKADELEAAELKTALRTSDIVSHIMDIEGVIAVNNLLLTKYDAEGNVVKGAWDGATSDKISALWLLAVTPSHQPRLYHNLSRFLFFKNGLPFLPREDEAYDTLTQLRGEAERPKIKNAPNDLPVPTGTFRNPEDYFPVQYSFPLTYGIGTDGLPSHASTLRHAQARQMKAYLMVFEQHLGNALAQLAHTADLFSLDPKVRRTYFVREFSEAVLQGYDEITKGLDQTALENMTETDIEFHERRNRFLNHLMARFGEQFGEYALLLTNLQGQQIALDRLIDTKISFLKEYPVISHDRGKAFNYRLDPCSPHNSVGIKRRVNLLLGHPPLTFIAVASKISAKSFSAKSYRVKFQLADPNKAIWMEGYSTVAAENTDIAKLRAFREVIEQMTQPTAYSIAKEAPKNKKFHLHLHEHNGNPLGACPILFDTKREAEIFREKLLDWSSSERAMVVEHLLLRPKFPGDALYPACVDGACGTCGDEDPYSFRLTFVMPGWTAPYNTNMAMRDFADRTIRQETPSHLLGKICWVGNDGFIENSCDPVIDELAGLLVAQGLTSKGETPTETAACRCAKAIYTAFSKVFRNWYEDKTLDFIHSDALKTQLEGVFNAKAKLPAKSSCTTVLDTALWSEIQVKMVKHFHHAALYGCQFERFEDAWCKWLEANAAFDWTEERLQDRVEAILIGHLVASATTEKNTQDPLRKCAAAILTKYGMTFYSWMETNIKAGQVCDEKSAVFSPNIPVAEMLCTGFTFKSDTAQTIKILLDDRYNTYKEVSCRLWAVVNLLSELRNIYPGATLHDCDDGSDQNPVRLGSTALGHYPLRQT